MIVAIPFNPSLPGGYDRLVSAIIRYGKHPNHTLFVVSRAEHEDAAFEMAITLKDQFGRFFIITVPDKNVPPLQRANNLFVGATDALLAYEPTEDESEDPAMLYFDPLWRPVKARWLDEFNSEYHIFGAKPTYGCFDGDKVIGPVVLKRSFLKKSLLINFLPTDRHWREYLAWEIITNGLHADALGKNLPAYIRPFDPA